MINEPKMIWWTVDKKKFLEAFAEDVEIGDYEKIPYQRWRELSRSPDSCFDIAKIIYENPALTTSYRVYFTTYTTKTHVYYEFSVGDNSMGSFLTWNFGSPDLSYDCDEKENHEMFCSDNENDYIKENDYRKYINNVSANGYTTATQRYDTTTTTGITPDADNRYSNTITTESPYSLGDSWVAIHNDMLKENDVRKICEDILNKKENDLHKICEDILNEKKKEKNTMDTSKIFNFDFGPVSGSQFRMSPYGLAVRTQANGWVAFNAANGELMDVDVINFDLSKMIYKMPVAQSAIAAGDILIHGGKPVFVRNANTNDGTVNVIDYSTASVMDILPVKSPFGFNFFTKVVCFVDMNGASAASPDNPFGGLLPFLMLGEGKDFDPMMLMFMGGNMNFASNPMMMYFMLNSNSDGKDNSNLLPLFLMMNSGNMPSGNAGPATI